MVLQQLPIKLTALINDTTGTLIASHYVNPRTKIAVIFGTGCNAAYMEHVKDIEKINDLNIDGEADMAINCEWVRLITFRRQAEEILTERVFREPLIRSSTSISRGRSTTPSSMIRLTSLGNKLLR